MRLLWPLSLLLGCVACAGPNSSRALWTQQYADQEKAYFSLSDAQHQAQARDFERSLADEGITSEARRVDAALQTCPGPSQPLTASTGDMARDAIRVQSSGDSQSLDRVAALALEDWYVRRGSATGDSRFCQKAESARAGQLQAPAATLLDSVPPATVTRDGSQGAASPAGASPLTTLSLYVLGTADTVSADPPLPHYLAWVYGGTLLTDAQPVEAETAAALVDAQAPAYPDWEPDALYAALRGSRP
jgi:hypothetical protein